MSMNDLERKNISVLLVDDDEDDYIIIKRTFAQIPDSPFSLRWCSDFEAAKELIESRAFDIFLIDYRLGAHTGLELLEAADAKRRSEPFILLTGAGDARIEHKSMELAAADYLVKGSLEPDALSRALFYALGRKQIESQRLQHFIDLNKTKDEFISLASHQLRTPATGVKQYLGMVLEEMAGEVPPAQYKLLQKAYESNERQLAIVSDLLKVAQVDAGKVHLRQKPTDIVALLTDVVKEQQATYSQRQQQLEMVAPAAVATAMVDPGKIRMVFENMIDNASKYSDQGKTVSVTVSHSDNMILVAIRDAGVGVDSADIEKLFEKFNRIHNHLSNHVGGTGLGLYWAKKIIDLHGGIIKVDSILNEGSTFTVMLPTSTQATQAPDNDIKRRDV